MLVALIWLELGFGVEVVVGTPVVEVGLGLAVGVTIALL